MFPAFRSEVEAALEAALADLGYPTGDLGVEEPPEDVDAVLASSVAFRLAGVAEAPPAQVATELADAVDVADLTYVERATAAGPYVNFAPAPAYYGATLEAAQQSGFARRPDTGESVVVEHTSANPTGPVHVGRARNPIVGDALARVLDAAGNDVDVHYYVNDAGRQLALFTWAYETFDEADLDAEPERDRPDYDLVRYYRKGNAYLESADPEDVEAAEAEIAEILSGLDAGDEATLERVSTVVDQVLSGMRATLDRLPADFDEWVRETRFMRPPEAGGAAPPDGFATQDADSWTEDVTARLRDLDEAVYEEGAWQLDLSADGIEKKLVFERSDGTSLYATRDLAHHEWKLANYDRAVAVFGEDHELQSRQVQAALRHLGTDTDRIDAVLHSWVNLPGGEGMSTRAGTGVDLDDLLDEAVVRAREAVESRLDDRSRADLTDEDVARIAGQVGIGAVRYDIVATQPTKAITFDWEDALDFEAQSAPYVQYAHARACGILERGAGEDGASVTADHPDVAVAADRLTTDEARALLREVARFPAVIEDAADSLEPHVVATYVRGLADAFNAFYRVAPVLDADPELRAARLAVVVAARNALADGLGLLGIEAPEAM
ncbi:MAG: arginine--tRNA ligase [Halobacteriaceae archaeon]